MTLYLYLWGIYSLVTLTLPQCFELDWPKPGTNGIEILQQIHTFRDLFLVIYISCKKKRLTENCATLDHMIGFSEWVKCNNVCYLVIFIADSLVLWFWFHCVTVKEKKLWNWMIQLMVVACESVIFLPGKLYICEYACRQLCIIAVFWNEKHMKTILFR